MREPPPPHRPGDRVRCVVSTVEAMRGIELLGRVGTVDRATYYDETDTPGWDIIVVWDGLLPRLLAHRAPEELEPAGASATPRMCILPRRRRSSLRPLSA